MYSSSRTSVESSYLQEVFWYTFLFFFRCLSRGSFLFFPVDEWGGGAVRAQSIDRAV